MGQTWEPPASHSGLVSTPTPPPLGSNSAWIQSGSLDPATLESSVLRQSLTDLVKEVMKPAWRANRLSREMFKSLAKTAVDRVRDTHQLHQNCRFEKLFGSLIQLTDSSKRALNSGCFGLHQVPTCFRSLPMLKFVTCKFDQILYDRSVGTYH